MGNTQRAYGKTLQGALDSLIAKIKHKKSKKYLLVKEENELYACNENLKIKMRITWIKLDKNIYQVSVDI